MFEQPLGQFGVQGVAAAVGDDVADDFAAGEGQVADDIEHLVTGALVGKPQRVADRSVGTEDQ